MLSLLLLYISFIFFSINLFSYFYILSLFLWVSILILSFCFVSLHLRATAKTRLLSARFIRLTYVVYRQYLITIFLTCSHEEFMKKNQVLFSDVFRGYTKRPVACIRLRNIVVKQITHHMVTQKPHSCCQVPANNLTNNLN